MASAKVQEYLPGEPRRVIVRLSALVDSVPWSEEEGPP
jgi:hypothetical protein